MVEVGQQPIIVFEHVSKSFSGRVILKDITFSLRSGEIFGLIGPSGSGKTTILRTLIGFYAPDGGRVLYLGSPVKNVHDLAWAVGFATQDECFYDDLTCEENLRYFAAMYHVPHAEVDARITRLLETVELSHARHNLGKQLSGGMKRRLDIAIALLHRPRILILDEPTNGLDPVLRKHMLSLIERISREGIAIIITSHLLEDLEHLCTNIGILVNGCFAVQGNPTEIMSRHCPYNEIHLVTYPGNYERILQAASGAGASIMSVSLEQHQVRIATMRTEETVYALLRVLPSLGEHLIDIDVLNPNLESVFERLVERPEDPRAP